MNTRGLPLSARGSDRRRARRQEASLPERKAQGRAIRNHVPRAEQGRWAIDTLREDLSFILARTAKGSPPQRVAMRWRRMATSLLAFFQDAAAVMAADFRPCVTSGLEVQVCGNAHLLNIDARAGTAGSVAACLADLDETCRGPFEWDVKRLAASLVVAGREIGHDETTNRGAVRAMVRAYRELVERCSRLPAHELATVECAVPAAVQPLISLRALPTPRPRLTPADPVLASAVQAGLDAYARTLAPEWRTFVEEYTAGAVAPQFVTLSKIDFAAFRVVLRGRAAATLALDVKEQHSSCWRDGEEVPATVAPAHEGRRVAEAERRVHACPDPLLGWTRVAEKDVTVRSARPSHVDLDPHGLSAHATFESWARLCGEVVATAHARTGDAAAIAGYAGRNDRLDCALAGFAAAYADQTELDYERFRRTFADRLACAG